MQRWIAQRHCSREAGRITSHTFTNENWGLCPEFVGIKVNDHPLPMMRYKNLICKKDWRKTNRRKMQVMAKEERNRVWQAKENSEYLRAEDEVRSGYVLDGENSAVFGQ